MRPYRHLITFTVFLLALFISFHSGPVRADQTDPRLPGLFDSLRTATNAAAAQATADRIWRIWSENPDNALLTQTLNEGVAQMNAGRLREAERLFTSVIEADPDFAEAWNKRATLYFLMGAYDLSKRDIAQTIAREPQHFGALSGLGLVETHIGNYDAALKAYEQAAAIHPFMDGYDDIVSALKKLVKGTAL